MTVWLVTGWGGMQKLRSTYALGREILKPQIILYKKKDPA
jgi:hypothetical protein